MPAEDVGFFGPSTAFCPSVAASFWPCSWPHMLASSPDIRGRLEAAAVLSAVTGGSLEACAIVAGAFVVAPVSG